MEVVSKIKMLTSSKWKKKIKSHNKSNKVGTPLPNILNQVHITHALFNKLSLLPIRSKIQQTDKMLLNFKTMANQDINPLKTLISPKKMA